MVPEISQCVGVFPFGPSADGLIEIGHFLLYRETLPHTHQLISCDCHLATFGHVSIQGDERIKLGDQSFPVFRLHVAFAVTAIMHRHAEGGIHFRPPVSGFGVIIVQGLIIVRLDADDREQVVVEDLTVHTYRDKGLESRRLVGSQQFCVLNGFLPVFLRLLGVVVANFHHIGQHRLIDSRQSGVPGVGRPFLLDQVADGIRNGIGREFAHQ